LERIVYRNAERQISAFAYGIGCSMSVLGPESTMNFVFKQPHRLIKCGSED